MSRRRVPTPTSIRLAPDLRKRLEKRADQKGWYLSVYIVRILEQEMDRLDGRDQPLPQFTPEAPNG